MGMTFHLETNSQISMKNLGTMLEDTSKPICPLICFNAWQVFIQLLYLRMIFHSPLPIAMKVAQYFMLHYHPVKGSLGRTENRNRKKAQKTSESHF